MTGKVERVLYLDSDYFLTLGNPALAGIGMEVVVEVAPDATTARHEWLLSDGVNVLTDRPLMQGDRMSVYEPTTNLLAAIESETASGRYDWVIIGNNRGAGLVKAKRVAEAMRGKTLIVANSYPVEEPYRKLGFRYFASRDAAGRLLARLIAELRSVPTIPEIVADERCSSCGDKLLNGECTNYFCPMHDRY